MSASSNKSPAGIVWFEIATDDAERVETSYPRLFGWKMKRFRGNSEYRHLDTGGLDALPGAGTMKKAPRPLEEERKCKINVLNNSLASS